MHARAVVAHDRLGHKGRGLAVLLGDVMHHVFIDLHVVGGVDQGGELKAQFGL